MPELQAGDPRRLGEYDIIGRLGEGGQGVVYLGRTPAGREVAVKLLRADLAGDEAARRRFVRELQTATKVARFCTAQVLEADVAGDRPFIVSEYVPGPSLQHQVMQEGPRSGAALERLAVGTATALVAIHQAGIVHRDFKPHNVLIGPDGPRVIDFGVARALDVNATSSTGAIGTPAYMAPEQIMGHPVTAAADTFSWASTMVFASTGATPFGSDSIPAVINRILNEDPDLDEVPGDLRELVRACLAKDPSQRPQAQDLLMCLLGQDGGVLPSQPAGSTPAGAAGDTAGATAATVAGAAGAAGAAAGGLPVADLPGAGMPDVSVATTRVVDPYDELTGGVAAGDTRPGGGQATAPVGAPPMEAGAGPDAGVREDGGHRSRLPVIGAVVAAVLLAALLGGMALLSGGDGKAEHPSAPSRTPAGTGTAGPDDDQQLPPPVAPPTRRRSQAPAVSPPPSIPPSPGGDAPPTNAPPSSAPPTSEPQPSSEPSDPAGDPGGGGGGGGEDGGTGDGTSGSGTSGSGTSGSGTSGSGTSGSGPAGS